ncbi:MAG: DUF5658 family protein [Candidatus Methanomethyliaceae archaeon]
MDAETPRKDLLRSRQKASQVFRKAIIIRCGIKSCMMKLFKVGSLLCYTNFIFVVLWIVLNALDILTTLAGFEMGLSESNPILLNLFGFSPTLALLIKVVVMFALPIVVLYILEKIRTDSSKRAFLTQIVILCVQIIGCFFYAKFVINNILVIAGKL